MCSHKKQKKHRLVNNLSTMDGKKELPCAKSRQYLHLSTICASARAIIATCNYQDVWLESFRGPHGFFLVARGVENRYMHYTRIRPIIYIYIYVLLFSLVPCSGKKLEYDDFVLAILEVVNVEHVPFRREVTPLTSKTPYLSRNHALHLNQSIFCKK